MKSKRPIIMVSSTVYGIEELLNRIYGLLTSLGYEVWMSYKGTVPVNSNYTAFENCINAVKKCDLFLGIVTTSYGSGKDTSDISITHKEILEAIKLKKPRWFLVDSNVVFARRLLIDLGYKTKAERDKLNLKKKATSLEDIRVIDMYEDAIREQLKLPERVGNWAQPFTSDEDALLFASAQFSRFQEAEAFIEENLTNPEMISKIIEGKGV